MNEQDNRINHATIELQILYIRIGLSTIKPKQEFF